MLIQGRSSITSGLMISMRSIAGVIGLPIYSAIFNSKLSAHLGKDIAAAVLPLGLPNTSLPALIGDLAGGITPTPDTVPGVTPEIIQAGVGGLLSAYNVAFRFVWITAAVLSFCATFGKRPSPYTLGRKPFLVAPSQFCIALLTENVHSRCVPLRSDQRIQQAH